MAIAPTVRFDVGGTMYTVACSLLEQHPSTVMAKMASNTWKGEPQSSKSSNDGKEDTIGAPLFINGNGERFQYVLDYMRQGKVTLPQGKISKTSLLEDLDYYGFENVTPESIRVEFLAFEAAQAFISMEKAFGTARKRQKTGIESMEFVEICYLKFRSTRSSRISFSTTPYYGDEEQAAYNFCLKAQSSEELKQISSQYFQKFYGMKITFLKGVVVGTLSIEIGACVPNSTTG